MVKEALQEVAVKLLTVMLPIIIKQISPVIKDYIKDAIVELEVKAKESHNPYDDVLVMLLKMILDIE